jgi:hypothetical protein
MLPLSINIRQDRSASVVIIKPERNMRNERPRLPLQTTRSSIVSSGVTEAESELSILRLSFL